MPRYRTCGLWNRQLTRTQFITRLDITEARGGSLRGAYVGMFSVKLLFSTSRSVLGRRVEWTHTIWNKRRFLRMLGLPASWARDLTYIIVLDREVELRFVRF